MNMLQSDKDYFEEFCEEFHVDLDPNFERKLSLIRTAQKVDSLEDIPGKIQKKIRSEYKLKISEIYEEISEGCVAEGYPACGSNFDLRIEARQADFDFIFEETCLKYGYIIEGEM